MEKNVSIVKVDKRHYRTIARENWSLTKNQMKGMHVHHRIPRSEGGTNDATNLYVCSPSFHGLIWHNDGYFIEKASLGGAIQGSRNKIDKTGIFEPGASSRGGKTQGSLNALNKTGFCGRSPEKMIEDGKKGGNSCRIKKVGIFGRSPEKVSEDSRNSGKRGGKVQGNRNALNKTGFCGRSPEKMAADGKRNAAITTKQKWIDPDHPELGVQNAGNLVQMQKSRNYPHGKENRVRVG